MFTKALFVLLDIITLLFIFCFYEVAWLYNLVIFYWWFMLSLGMFFILVYMVSDDYKILLDMELLKQSKLWVYWERSINFIIAMSFVSIGHISLATFILLTSIISFGIRKNATLDN